MIEPEKPAPESTLKTGDDLVKFKREEDRIMVYRGDEQIGAIPLDSKELAGYILALNQILSRYPSIFELVQMRQVAGRVWEGGEI